MTTPSVHRFVARFGGKALLGLIFIFTIAAVAIPLRSVVSKSNGGSAGPSIDREKGKAKSKLSLLTSFAQLSGETVELYAADCATPKTSFALGETVCAKTDGVDVVTSPGNYYMNWVDSQLNQTNGGTITQNPQYFLFVPPTAGSWKATIGSVNPADSSIVGNPPIFTVSSSSAGISTFDGTCATATTEFVLNQKVCAIARGGTVAPRRLVWIDPSGNARQVDTITSDPQSITFDIPATQTSVVGNVTVDNRGKWKVNMISSRGSAVATASFVVSDPQNPTADVQVVKSGGGDVAAGSGGVFKILVYNSGPDAATNVTVTDPLPSQINFVAISQTGSPAFTCVTPSSGSSGTITCTAASMPAESRVSIEIAFEVATGTASGSIVPNTATASTGSVDSNSANDSSTAYVNVPAGGGGSGTCSVACPDDITTPANTVDGSNNPGAIVHFSPPSGNLQCGTVTADHCNDCFFPQGVTVVTGTSESGDTCSFTVTVTPGGSAPTINCPGDKTGNADSSCSATFNLGTASATGTNVTVVAFRSDGQPVYTCDEFGNCTRNSSDAPFSVGQSTVTWIAYAHDIPGPYNATTGDEESHRNGSASCTQTVVVNDVTPPVITATDSSASADANCQAAVPDYSNSAQDNCACASSDTSEICQDRDKIVVTQDVAAGTLVGLGPHTIHLTATDEANNTSTKTITFTVVDTTAPVVSCPSNVTVYLPLNSTAVSMPVSYSPASATDNCDSSVTIGYSQASGSVFPVGTTTVTVTATDDANNSSTCTFTVTVLYDFTGFFAPVENLPTLNVVNAGRGIPVKFSLSGNKGLNIFAANSPSSVAINCDGSAPQSDVQETVTAGGSSLSYSSGSDQYVYTWKTESSWAGTCRQLTVKLNDGTEHKANFKFR